jgi:wyosine [tRNA(Phe)-imidazoG37] synthetase (radical SAM superfamily)
MQNKYCSQKFWWLTVEPQKRAIASCCAADPVKIDITWLDKNPGKLFNIPQLQLERQQMLDGQTVESCYRECWRAELQGLTSRRIQMGSDKLAETDINASPSILSINLSTDCNLTCTYCGKFYSTAWLNDIATNGPYIDEPRFTLNSDDAIVLALGQKTLKNTDAYQLIIDEALKLTTVKQVILSGGEPFLYNGLVELINKIDAPVNVYTGLGVNANRFKSILEQLPKHVTLTISAENVGPLYEFNRYGNSYNNFLDNLNLINSLGISYNFSSVISNLTIHGYKEFQKTFSTSNDTLNLCLDPEYLGANILDDASKELINVVDYEYFDSEIKQTIVTEYDEVNRKKCNLYLLEFARRRQLSLEIFPSNFIEWLDKE